MNDVKDFSRKIFRVFTVYSYEPWKGSAKVACLLDFQNSPSSASRPKSSLRSPRNSGGRLVASLHAYPRMLLASYIFFPAFWWGTTAGRQITFPVERKYVRLGNRLSRTNQKRSRTYLMLTFNLLKLLCKSSATSATANKLGPLVQPKVEFRRTCANIDRT